MTRLAVLTAALLLSVRPIAVAQTPPSTRPTKNHPPIVTSNLPPHAVIDSLDLVRMKITVTDADGDPVYARLTGDLIVEGFRPIKNEPSGATREFLYVARGQHGGRHELAVEAWDARQPTLKTTYRFPFMVIGDAPAGELTAGVQTVDLDGDGTLEIFARAPEGDWNGATDCGALALFDPIAPTTGASPSPRLHVTASPQAYAALGGFEDEPSMQIADVTGDGVPDLIGVDHVNGGTIYVWSAPHGLGGFATPDAVLHGPDPTSGVSGGGLRLWIDDVTNDGVPDVLVVNSNADTPTVDAGEIYLFAGGPAILGTPAPTAILRVPGAAKDDWLGGGLHQGLFVADLTGDGVRDIIAATPYADRGTTADVGKIYVWSGTNLTGTVAPTATLDAKAASSGSRIGDLFGTISGDREAGVALVDVTGDGVLDVVANSLHATSAGCLFVWKGGAGLVGTVDATAQLKTSNGNGSTRLGMTEKTQGILFADLNLDGVNDVICDATYADVGSALYAGSIYVWAGGNLRGAITETARLQRATPKSGDHLGSCNGNGLQLADVTGDGHDDLLAITPFAEVAQSDEGEIDVWAAQTNFTGVRTPSAILTVPNAALSDLLGYEPDGFAFPKNRACPMLALDVTGDGVNDVIAVDPYADQGGPNSAGAGYVWAGGAAMASGATLAPTATLIAPNYTSSSELGFREGFGAALHAVDFDDDGILDVALCSDNYGAGTERVLFWFGGAGLVGTPAPGVTAESSQPGDFLAPWGGDLVFTDVNDDLVLDLLVSAPSHTFPGSNVQGALYLFEGGAATRTGPPITTILPYANTYLNRLLMPRDVDHDGFVDLVIADPDYSAGTGLQNIGAVKWFRGPLHNYSGVPQIFTAGRILKQDSNLAR